ncbi:MAG: SRPBCC family protein [Ignavibacteriaceae bacterium]
MIALQKSILIDRAKEDVFSFVSNYKNDPKWRTGVIEMNQEPLKTKIGTITNETVRFLGFKIIFPAEITEYYNNFKVSFRTTAGPFESFGFREVMPEEGWTNFTYSLSSNLKGIYKIFSLFLQRIYNRRMEKDLKKLKAILEAGEYN